MSNKNIVSIEDRIPKLKQARKKKANRRLVFYLSIFFLLISIIVYLQSPLSHVRTINVTGNIHVADDIIINESKITTDSNMWMVDLEGIQSAIKKNPIIDQVEVKRSLPWTIDIQVTEHELVGYNKVERDYYPILGNGHVLKELGNPTYNGSSPILIGFTEEDYLHKMATELNQLPSSISKLISEVHWSPTEDNNNRIYLYMNDGYIVEGTMRDFAEKMEVYPSIVSQLDPEVEGIIHIGVGVYFESFEEVAPSDNESTETEEVPNEDDESAEE
ncbi:cell division protein FtsQ/DivIB [Oceanobacillus piezotolerans]|uniref:Cell division protein DivIB n=1 Tax=Oceanobacillus piezotolerans TaxID=2448030 RepID=A0A498D692_9BACI|nr:cell division protein FtsQ/DivIB [Oceanobacillus piezotolerans]RLL45238.1 cell division protein FtsQ/DivIB [Oceanobacillus piezotolerans]